MKKMFLTTLLVIGGLAAYAQPAQTAPASEKVSQQRDLPNSVQSGTSDRKQIKMFPNPTSGGITIEGFVVNFSTSYVISDATGRQVMSGSISADNNKIDVSSLLNGMYFVAFKSEHETVVLRLVKQ
jgi:hypothetical protein